MSALTGQDAHITHIRAKRKNPGLNYQHIASIKAVAALCGAEVDGLSLGSQEITFRPGDHQKETLSIDIGTAGSISLVLQSLIVASSGCKSKISIEITGGTNVSWSPPIDYVQHVTIPILSRFGYKARLEILKRGFYPRGGGKVRAVIEPHSLSKLELLDRGEFRRVEGVSISANLPDSVSKRMTSSCAKNLTSKAIPNIQNENVESLSPGAAIVLWATYENTVLGADSLGRRGKPAETVGREAGQSLLGEMERDSCIDTHMADQIIPFLALAGGTVRTGELSDHAKTNLMVVNKFVGDNLTFRDGVLGSTDLEQTF
jgi:RNA 3'-phosphate cyclase